VPERNLTIIAGMVSRLAGYLGDRRFAAHEVSFMLAYSEPATFFRAFKRWTWKTPQEYRASL